MTRNPNQSSTNFSPAMEVSPADSPARLSEFEFWASGNNPSAPQTHILAAADDLFSGGIILPLNLLSLSNSGDPASSPAPEPPPPPQPESASIASAPSGGGGASRRWKDIFKAGEKKFAGDDEKGKNKRKERKRITGGGGAAELNINIWPFTRSRSAGNGGSARPPAPARKASSAPCSRSNSRGEPGAGASTPRRCAASPGRNGVHVGRSSHVCRQMKNAAAARKSIGGGNAAGKKAAAPPAVVGGGGGGGGGITCIGYRARRPASCRVEGKLRGGGDHGGGRLINLRAIFSKNVH